MKRLPTWVEVDLDRLTRNLDNIQRHIKDDVGLLLTVKADAYGHGAVQVAQAAEGHVRMFGVATIDEAVELREAGITTAILVLSPVLDTEIPAVASGGFAVTVSSRGLAERLSVYGVAHEHTFEIHVEVDTGMGRTGIPAEFAREEVAVISHLPSIRLEGVYTHFPVSDTDHDFTSAQIVAFDKLVKELKGDGIPVPIVHSANSAAIADIKSSHMDMIRPGLLAYGLHPDGRAPSIDVAPILSWKSRLARVRRVPGGRSISYGRDYTTSRDSWIGVVPVGYGHGYPYRLSDRGSMLVDGRRVELQPAGQTDSRPTGQRGH
ncbi:MAG: alanine racemase, partial [Candidatus Krumholzibacteriota bacterium]|nr:alanine racemase [Candidatus Krumholzibacteriota bacterium]